MDSHFAMPENLSPEGQNAWKTIVTILMSEDPQMSTGGCTAFYSPQKWRERGERYGVESELIVVYDGGEHRRFFTYDEDDYEAMERVNAALGAIGFYLEECTGWYAAVYPK